MEHLERWRHIISQINSTEDIQLQKYIEALSTNEEEQEQTLIAAENFIKILKREVNKVEEVINQNMKEILQPEFIHKIVAEEISEITSSEGTKTIPIKFTPEIIQLLKTFFTSQPYPTTEQKQQLCLQTGLSETQINTWFQNARNRNKIK